MKNTFIIFAIIFMIFINSLFAMGEGEEEMGDDSPIQKTKKIFHKNRLNTRIKGEIVETILISIDDQEVRTDNYKGAFTLVSFGATWCPPCREELPTSVR